jgi:hypothetical protein
MRLGVRAPLVVLGIAAIALAGATRTVEAQSAPSTREPRRVVRLTIAARDAEAAAIEATLREILEPLGLVLEIERARSRRIPEGHDAAEGDTLAVVWIDLLAPRLGRTIVKDPSTGEALTERRIPRDASSAVMVEEVSEVVHACVEAAWELERERSAITARERPPDDAIAPTSEVEPERPWQVSIAALGSLRQFESGVLTVLAAGGEAAIELDAGDWLLAIRIGAEYAPSFTIALDHGAAEFSALDFRLAVAVARHLYGPFALEFALGLGLEVRESRTRLEPPPPRFPPLPPPPDTLATALAPTLAAGLGLRIDFMANVGVLVRAGIEVEPLSTPLLLELSGREQFVPDPWHVRPKFELGLAVRIP